MNSIYKNFKKEIRTIEFKVWLISRVIVFLISFLLGVLSTVWF